MNLTTIALSAVFAIVPCNLALAQGSDTCATAQPVAGPGPHGVGLAGATPGPPSAAGCPTHDTDVWFSWTAPSTGQFAFRLCGTSVVGWTASVLDGCGGNALECRNYNCQYDDDRLLFQAVAGADYIFRVSSVVSWASGTFYVEPFTPAANDECASPEALDTFGSFPFDLNLATGGSDLGTQCFHAVNDLWFEWTAPLSTLATFSCVEPGIYLGLYSACGGVELECNTYNVLQGDSHLRFQTVAGASYLIRVGSTGTSNRASAMLDITPGTPRVYGGNGHAYTLVPDQLTWEGANAAAMQQTHLGVQGHLATVSNAAENDFLTTFQAAGSWFGLYQDTTDPGFFEPSGGWKWVTGEPLNYTQWAQPHEPNN
ncbi:MAG: lectin-like protein, partial [Planctomycetota bacterium]|nr:lectin-like protein [Planctomycetota bacterium]